MEDRAPDEGRQDYANQMLRLGHSSSTDGTDREYASAAVHTKYKPHQVSTGPTMTHHKQQHQSYAYRAMPPAYPTHHAPHHAQARRNAPPAPPYPYNTNPANMPTSQPRGPHSQNRLQSVVTTSFSIDDDREDVNGPRGYYHHPRPQPPEDRHPSEPMPRRERDPTEEREISDRDSAFANNHREAPPMLDSRAPIHAKHSMSVRIPPSPGEESSAMPEMSPKVTPEALKRSFWHHSRPADSAQQSMHPAFAPPKRAKVGSARKERDIIMTPRPPGANDAATANEFPRASSWAGPDDDHHHRYYRHSSSFPAPWQHPPPHVRHSSSFGVYPEPMDESPHYSRSWSTEEPMGNRTGAFRSVGGRMPPRPMVPHPPPYHTNNGPIAHQTSFPTPRHHPWGRAESYDWTPPPHDPWHAQHRDDMDSRDLRSRSYSRDMSWDDRDSRPPTFDSGGGHRYYEGPPQRQQHHKVTPNGPVDGPQRPTLSKKHDAMADDTSSAATGGPLLLLAQPEDRISLSETLCTIRENIEVFTATKPDVEAPAPGRKHPVVVGQVGLRCIHCRHTTKSSDRVKRAVCYPSSIKRIYRTVIDMKLDHFAHCRFVPNGLKDRLEELKAINTRSTGTTMQYFVRAATKMGMVDAASGVRLAEQSTSEREPASSSPERPREVEVPSPETPALPQADSIDSPMRSPSDVIDASPLTEKSLQRSDSDQSDFSMAAASDASSIIDVESSQVFMGKTTLALPEDRMALSSLRCFLRENVYAFAATEEDIAVRTPTTFSVVVGQVGIGCVHCHSLPAKERSNRAVCFPFAINRIYQSVADIQRFHLGECKMVPLEVREKFQSLQSASSKGSKGLATRQYWVTSAKKIGLADTTKGIRFVRDPLAPTTQAVSLDILAQVASNVTTVDRPLVLPEDKPIIAEFLYAVMEQLQPCRFTEADRNKRRLKDVGCIGVECKHCAGQVESRKFFWSSVNAVESNFVSVHTHMMECTMISPELKENLSALKQLRKEQTAKLKTGSQKAFFQRVWKRLHGGAQQQQLEENELQGQDGDAKNCVDTSKTEPNVSGEDMDGSPMSVSKAGADIEMTVISL